MSAVSNLDGTGTLDAAHRTDAPVWAFHLALAYTAWVVASVVWRVFHIKRIADAWEARSYDQHPVLFISGIAVAAAIIAAAITGTVVNA